MISQQSIQQVIQVSDIVEVIGQFIKLRRRGANYIANCPFHNEKTPSFNVNPAKGIYKCFGCGKGGDVVSFVEEYEKFSFTEAIRWLANFYQIALEETAANEDYKQNQQIEESLRIVNEYATKYFEDVLHLNEDGKLIGGSYFQERGFRENTIKQFRLGYCLDQWEAFSTTALAKGYNAEILEKAGLIKLRDGKPYDNYKGRVIFPIFSATGKIIGFGARILKKNDKAPKYINTPENELYVKNKVLYGLYQSRQSIGKLNECLLVEGYTDVISLHQAGITNVVSSSGTSLTEGQLKLISNLTKNLTILYDGDAAGVKAALRGLDMALAQSFNVKLVLLPEGEDPDSFVQKLGENDFRKYIEAHKRDVIEFRLEVGMSEVGNDPAKKSKLVNEIAETLSKINKVEDFSLQQYYIKESARLLEIDEEGLINLVNKFIRESVQQDQRQQQRTIEKETLAENHKSVEQTGLELDDTLITTTNHQDEWQLVKLLIEYGNKPYKESTVAQTIFDSIELDILKDELALKIATLYQDYLQKNNACPEIKYFINHQNKTIRERTAQLLLNTKDPSHNWMDMHKIEIIYGEKNYEAEVENSLAYFELKTIRKFLVENLKQLQNEKDTEEVAKLMRVHQLLQEREKGLLSIVIMK